MSVTVTVRRVRRVCGWSWLQYRVPACGRAGMSVRVSEVTVSSGRLVRIYEQQDV